MVPEFNTAQPLISLKDQLDGSEFGAKFSDGSPKLQTRYTSVTYDPVIPRRSGGVGRTRLIDCHAELELTPTIQCLSGHGLGRSRKFGR